MNVYDIPMCKYVFYIRLLCTFPSVYVCMYSTSIIHSRLMNAIKVL